MKLMEKLWTLAKQDKQRIVLAEGEEERNLIACGKIMQNSLADIILIGNRENIIKKAKELGISIEGATIEDPVTSEKTARYAKELYELRKNKGMTPEKAEQTAKDPLYFGTLMVKLGEADGMVSGAIHTTGDLLRPGLQVIKTAPGSFSSIKLPLSCLYLEAIMVKKECCYFQTAL
jgi:phosphate acetyltransferase